MTPPEQSHDVTPALPKGKILLTVLCHRCGYNLKGVDPAGACPECGLSVWPSLQPLVDPTGVRMALLDRPRRLGFSLITVSGAMLASAVALWWPYVMALARQMSSPGGPLIPGVSIWRYAFVGSLAGVALLATLGLQHPTGAQAPSQYRKGLNIARIGLIAWTALHAAIGFYANWAPRSVHEWFDLVQVDAGRSLLRLGLDGAALMMVIGFRPVVQFLGRHSIPHRLGGASRQGFLAILVAVLAVTCGELTRLATRALEAGGLAEAALDNLALIGTMLVLTGSAMTTLALLNLTIDSSRMARILARRLRRVDEVIG